MQCKSYLLNEETECLEFSADLPAAVVLPSGGAGNSGSVRLVVALDQASFMSRYMFCIHRGWPSAMQDVVAASVCCAQ